MGGVSAMRGNLVARSVRSRSISVRPVGSDGVVADRAQTRHTSLRTLEGMHSVDLALYADMLAGEAASLAARIERERGKQRQAAIEHAARRALNPIAIQRLEELGLLRTRGDPLALVELEEALDAVEVLQAWVEEGLGSVAAA